jgi:hypothetical protein
MLGHVAQLKAAIGADKVIYDARSADMEDMRNERDRLREQLSGCEHALHEATRDLNAIRSIVAPAPAQPASLVYNPEVDPPSSPSVDGDFSNGYNDAIHAEIGALMARHKTNEAMRRAYYYAFGSYPAQEQGRFDMAHDIAADKEFNEPEGYVRRRESGRAERVRSRQALQRGPRRGGRVSGHSSAHI